VNPSDSNDGTGGGGDGKWAGWVMWWVRTGHIKGCRCSQLVISCLGALMMMGMRIGASTLDAILPALTGADVTYNGTISASVTSAPASPKDIRIISLRRVLYGGTSVRCFND
jgi:hypothetical protein